MSTLTHPAPTHRALTHRDLNHRAGAESLVAAVLAAVAILVLLVWAMSGAAGFMTNLDDTRAPSPQPQIAPRPTR